MLCSISKYLCFGRLQLRGFCCLIFLKCSLLRMLTEDSVSIITWTGTSVTLTVILQVFFEGIIV